MMMKSSALTLLICVICLTACQTGPSPREIAKARAAMEEEIDEPSPRAIKQATATKQTAVANDRAKDRAKENEAEIDRILDKIARSGIDSLSDAERVALKRATDEKRDRENGKR